MALGKVPGQGGDAELDEEGIFAEINITPLTDIFLVLLIIFMVTSSVIADAGALRAGEFGFGTQTLRFTFKFFFDLPGILASRRRRVAPAQQHRRE